MSYGLAYGLSAFGLSGQLKISVDDAKEQMEAYFARFGGVRDYLRRHRRPGPKDGYTETVFGRRRYVPDLTSDNRQKREMAERAGAERADPGQRRRHHQGRHARRAARIEDARACARGCCCRCTTSWSARWSPGERDDARRWCRRRWAAPTRCGAAGGVRRIRPNWDAAAH